MTNALWTFFFIPFVETDQRNMHHVGSEGLQVAIMTLNQSVSSAGECGYQ